MKIVPGVYQYTAIDDCSKFRVLGVYTRANGSNTLDFLARIIEEMPFPIQRWMLIMAERSYLGLLSGGCLEADLKLHAESA